MIFVCSTYRNDVRSKIEGFTLEDPRNLIKVARDKRCLPKNVDVSLVVGQRSADDIYNDMSFEGYTTVLHALADGWQLLTSPTALQGDLVKYYEWWLIKDTTT